MALILENQGNDLATHMGSNETSARLIPLLLPALLQEQLCGKLMAYSSSSENKIYTQFQEKNPKTVYAFYFLSCFITQNNGSICLIKRTLKI